MFCTRLANGGLFPTGDPIVPFVISPRFECLNKLTHTVVYDQTLRGLLLFFPLSLYLRHSHRLCTRMTSKDLWEQRTDSRGPIVPIEKCPRRVWPYKLTQTCKHRQTESSHCSSFVYTLTFSQHLSYVLYTFGKRGPFSNWGPYCSFCYKSLVWMPKQTHTHPLLCKVYTEDLLLFPSIVPLYCSLCCWI